MLDVGKNKMFVYKSQKSALFEAVYLKTKYYFQKKEKVPPRAFTEHLRFVHRIAKPLRMARKQVHARSIPIYALNYYMTVLHTIG